MPVAGEFQPGNMGQDSKAQRSNPGLLSRVRKSIVKSRKGTYSFHESSQTYDDIGQSILVESVDMQVRNDYYQLDNDDTVIGEVNGCEKCVETNGDDMMNGKTLESDEDSDQRPAKMNGLGCKVTNGFHDVEPLSDADDVTSSSKITNSVKENSVEESYVNNGESSFHVNGAEPETYCVPGEATAAECVDDNPDFERQGAKPKQHYNKNKNGVREIDTSVALGTKRQAVKLNQNKAIGFGQENYLNVDLADIRVREEMDDDIREALKGPVLPPLVLPRDSQQAQSPSAPKTPHIEQVFRPDEMDEEELEEIKFASRALGLKLESSVMGNPSTNSNHRHMRPEAPSEAREKELGTDPSEAGLLLLSESDVSRHQDGLRGVDDVMGSNTYSATPVMDNQARVSTAMPNGPPVVDRTSKPVFSSDEDERIFQASLLLEPPPIPPRIPRRDDDEEPTHEAITHFKVPPKIRSLSLPRNISQGILDQQEQDQNTSKVNRRKVISSFFHRKSKRHSTFSERPLPAIPPLQPGKFPVNISRERAATMSTDRRLPEPPLEDYLDDAFDPDEEQPPPPPPKIPIKSPKELEKELEVQKILKARGEFASSLRKISDFGWYWGPMSWDDAETRLENTPDGSFLVRDSSDERHILSLSFRASGTTHHTRIEHQHGKFSFWSQPTSHGSTSVVDFIEEAMKHSHNGSFLYFLRPRMPGLPPAPVQLLYAISRFQKVRSLQHMCRFVIRKNIRLDHIDQLPLPKRLKNYIAGAHYYTPEALEP